MGTELGSRAVDVPTLNAGRVRLEPLSLAHSVGMFELWSSPEVCAYSGDAEDWWGNPLLLPAQSRQTSDAIIDFFARHTVAGNGFRWAVVEEGAEAFVGAIGFNALGAECELAWHQIPRFWGRGFMTEACRCGIEWARGENAERLVAFIEDENAVSVRLAERLGFAATDEVNDGARRFERLLAGVR